MGIKKVTSLELFEYIENNKLEYDTIIMLLFNDFGFRFLPLYKPQVEQTVHNGLPHFTFSANGYNILQSKYQFNTFMFDITKYNGESRFLYHPEHVYGYISMFQNSVKVEYYFERGTKGSDS